MSLRAPPLSAILDAWLERLDAEGFAVGIRERLTIQDFLARLAAAGDLPAAPAEVLRLIAPLLCTTPESQRRYAALLADAPAHRPPRLRRRRAAVDAPVQPMVPPGRRFWLAALVAVIAVLAVAVAWWQSAPPVPPPEAPPIARPEPPGTPAAAVALQVYTPAPANSAPRGGQLPPPVRTLAWLGAGLSALLLAFVASSRLRRTLYLQGTRSDAEVEEHVLTDPHAGRIEPQAAVIRVAARGLRQRVAGEREALDLPATLAATLRAAGAFSPRYRLLQHTPEYLALIDRRHPADHLAAYAEAVLAALAEHGVTLQVYAFHGSPDSGCWRLRPGTSGAEAFDPAGMPELAARYGGHRLLVFAEADALLDPLSAAPRRWTAALGAFPQRAWFTPMPMASWGTAEAAADRQGFLVLPTPAETMTTLAAWFAAGDLSLTAEADWPLAYPSLLRGEAVAWVARQGPPPDAVGEDLRFQLRAYLGAQRYQWLCACAIFPALSPTLTLALGRELTPDPRELALGMATLGALPWFRHGRMPPWLRQSLVTSLEAGNEVRYREVISRRLAGALEGVGGTELVRVATRRRVWAWLGRGRGAARDVVLVDFLRRDVLSRLAQRLPEGLRRRLFRNGLAAHGLRPLLVAGMAAVLGLGVALPLLAPWATRVLFPAAPETTVAVALVGCEDPLGVDADTRGLADALARAAPAVTGGAAALAVTAYAPGSWTAGVGRPTPAQGEIHHAAGDAALKALADALRRWLAARGTVASMSPWTVRAGAPGHEGVSVNACRRAGGVPAAGPSVATVATVSIRIGDPRLRGLAEQLAGRIHEVPRVRTEIALVDGRGRPARIELRRRESGDFPGLAQVIVAALGSGVPGPVVEVALPVAKGEAGKGDSYEVWLPADICVQQPRTCGQPAAATAVTIRGFSAQPAAIDRGGKARLCYVVDNAVRLAITPAVGGLAERSKGCVGVAPAVTTMYTLVATGEGNATARRSITLHVVDKARTLPLPSVTGQAFERAVATLAGLGLKVARTAASTPSRALPGTVIEQEPVAGREVTVGSVVVLGVVPAAAAPEPGWCCVAAVARQQVQQQAIAEAGEVFASDAKSCLGRGGRHFGTEEAARAVCAPTAQSYPSQAAVPAAWRDVDVAEMQRLLGMSGYYKGAVDGVFGDELVKALTLFQETNGIAADGQPGSQTLELLRRSVRKSAD